MTTPQEQLYAGSFHTPLCMIEHTSNEFIGLRNDIAQGILEIVNLSNEKDVLKVDVLQMARRMNIDMEKSLLESKINEILDHADAAWDEHTVYKAFLGTFEVATFRSLLIISYEKNNSSVRNSTY